MTIEREPVPKQQVNVRLDPALHEIMKSAKDVLGAYSNDVIYTMAIEEFLANHPEVIDGAQQSLENAQSVTLGALERLAQFRGTQSD
jgi:hypothetical protein